MHEDSKVSQRSKVIWIIVAAVAAAVVLGVLFRIRHLRDRSIVIQGAVIRRDLDTHKELPIADALVTISNGSSTVSTHSGPSGYFSLRYPPILWPGKFVDLSFQRDGYEPFDMKLPSGFRITTRQLYVAAMAPVLEKSAPAFNGKVSVVSNIRIRYTVNSESPVNVGSEARTFEVVNKGNVACNHQTFCSPDGSWKAGRGSVTLDAGQGNEFRDVRASCIAGPCPFTRIDASGFIHGGRIITASATDWSDPATFLVQAEVFHASINSNVRELYPVIFGNTLNFTLSPTQEGVSIEAEIDGSPMVFPLGPDLFLSWATCTLRNNSDADKTTVYRCELKPDYRF
jgi:hypothetical protein